MMWRALGFERQRSSAEREREKNDQTRNWQKIEKNSVLFESLSFLLFILLSFYILEHLIFQN